MRASIILIVGESECAHAEAVVGALNKLVERDESLVCRHLLPDSLESIDPAQHQQTLIIIFAEVRRDQFSRQTIEQTRDRFPLARSVIVQSEWCVGKKLPDDIFPGVTYVRIGEWESFIAVNIHSDAERKSMLLDLPVTASPEESRILASDLVRGEFAGVRFAIAANSFADFDAIGLMCKELGGTAFWIDTTKEYAKTETDVLVIICSDSLRLDSEHLANLCSACGATIERIPTILISSFPRLSDRQRLEKIGIQKVIAQPFNLVEFEFAIRNMLVAGNS